MQYSLRHLEWPSSFNDKFYKTLEKKLIDREMEKRKPQFDTPENRAYLKKLKSVAKSYTYKMRVEHLIRYNRILQMGMGKLPKQKAKAKANRGDSAGILKKASPGQVELTLQELFGNDTEAKLQFLEHQPAMASALPFLQHLLQISENLPRYQQDEVSSMPGMILVGTKLHRKLAYPASQDGRTFKIAKAILEVSPQDPAALARIRQSLEYGNYSPLFLEANEMLWHLGHHQEVLENYQKWPDEELGRFLRERP